MDIPNFTSIKEQMHKNKEVLGRKASKSKFPRATKDLTNQISLSSVTNNPKANI